MPKDRVTQSHQGYGFVEFLAEDDADYAIKIMNMIKLYGKPIRVNKVKYMYKCILMYFKLNCFNCLYLVSYRCLYYFLIPGFCSSKEP